RPGYSRKRAQTEKNPDDDTNKKPLTYADIIQRLVARFIHQTKKDMKMDGVNEDDLLEIKQDISSLRYELRDDRRREIVRSSSHIDAVKRDIMRTMSSTRSRGVVFNGNYRVPRASVAEENDLTTTDEEEDERDDSVSLLFTPPANSTLPEIFQDKQPCGVSPESPLRVAVTHDSTAASLEAIQNLRNELNQKLDLLIGSLSVKQEGKTSSDVNSNLTPSPKRNSKVTKSGELLLDQELLEVPEKVIAGRDE
ncbi:hypothetical protein TELCIR_19081, partial [Teladorsagia circumcincta]